MNRGDQFAAISMLLVVIAANVKAEMSLIAHFPFNEGKGGIIKDLITGRTGKIHGAQWVKTEFGPGLSFDGVKAFVDCFEGKVLGLTNQLSMCAWIKPTEVPKTETLIAGESPHFYGLTYYKNEKVYIYAAGQGGLSANHPIATNRWTHVAGAFDGKAIKIYINGILRKTNPRKPNHPGLTSKLRFRIGGQDKAGTHFKGIIRGVRVYSRALDQDEITSLASVHQKTKARKMQSAVDGLFRNVPAIPTPEQVNELLSDFRMTNWGASSSGNLKDYRTPELAAKRARKIKVGGANAVITNGLQNRLNYLKFADELAERQRIVADACHAQGLKVFDHLDLTIFWQSAYPLVFEHPEWAQRELRDGTPGRWLCLNQPSYREFYAQYLEKMVRAGIDGFMLDEVSFHDQIKTFCGCNHCRANFEKATGYRLPEFWDEEVINNRDNPLWQLWCHWQRKAIVEFKAFLLKRLQKINPNVVLLAYNTSIYRLSTRVSDMQEQARVCFVGTEGTNTVYPGYAHFYSQHRILSAFARKFGRPSWAHFAAESDEQFEFSGYHAAVTNSGLWGHLGGLSDIYNWEHWPEAHQWGEPVGDIAVVAASPSRDQNTTRAALHSAAVAGWCQAFGVSGVQFDIVPGLYAKLSDLKRFKAIVLPCTPSMPPRLIELIDRFVQDGGAAIVTGIPGRFDQLGYPLGDDALLKRMGFRSIRDTDTVRYIKEEFVGGQDRLLSFSPNAIPGVGSQMKLQDSYRFDPMIDAGRQQEVMATFQDGALAIVSLEKGKGRYIYIGFTAGQAVHQPRMYKNTVWADYLRPDLVSLMERIAREATGGQDRIRIEGRGILSAAYLSGSRLWVRLLNVSGVNLKPGNRVGDLKPSYPRLSEIKIHLKKSGASRATLMSPGLRKPMVLKAAASGTEDVFTLPAGAFQRFAFVRIEVGL
jgi:hypothetical protein